MYNTHYPILVVLKLPIICFIRAMNGLLIISLNQLNPQKKSVLKVIKTFRADAYLS